MSEFAPGVAAYVVLLVLAVAVAGRARRSGELPAALRTHQVVPPRAVPAVAAAVTAVEAVLAVALLVGLTRPAGPSPLVLAAAAAVFAGYGGYAWHVTASGRGGPCGCGTVEAPLGPWVIGRAFALAATALAAAAAHDAVLPLTRFDERLLLVLLAAATIGVLVWRLPAAMHVPTGSRPKAGAR